MNSAPAAIEPILSVRALAKEFAGVRAVQGVSFDVMPGQVVGFIGANGAGKTTTMRILATLEQPDAGMARVGGWDVVEHPHEVRRLLGWMPDNYGVYQHVTVFDYLDFYARACGLKARAREERVREVMEFADLTTLALRPMKGLSKGMAQRLCFGRALLQDPKVLILDEPAAGLDPKARLEFKNLVQILARRGVTIFISSHILSELSEMCDSLLFIDQGRIVHHGSAASLQHAGADQTCVIEIRVHGAEERLVEWLAVNPGWKVTGKIHGGVRAEYASVAAEDLAEQLRRLVREGVPVIDFHRHERRLEEVFVQVLKQQAASTAGAPPPLPGASLS